MRKREVKRIVQGKSAVDGAGVRLVRVLGHRDVEDFDPFLMLDSFDSTNPADYIAGFPMHPHRGIETITYLLSGKMEHEDSLGNKDVILSGESQWMTAGSGILHQEMPKPSERMLGFQLWLNLPRKEKMCSPAYLGITADMIPRETTDNAEIAILSGQFEAVSGVTPRHVAASLLDIRLFKDKEIELETNPEETVFVFLLEGDAQINGRRFSEKTAVLFEQGDFITVSALPDEELRFMFFSGKPLREPIAWGGPIVMNTRDELELAFDELRRGTFAKHMD